MKECVYCGEKIDGNGIYFCSKCKKKIKDLGYFNTGNVISDWTAQAYWYLEENGGNYWKDYKDCTEDEQNKQFVRPIDYIRFETYRDCIGADPKKFAMSAKHMNEMEKWYLELAEKYGRIRMARTICEPGRTVDVWGKECFKGKCPYTGKECESWECSRCQVEKNEKEWMEESEEE